MNSKQIRRILSDAAFNPKTPGPMKVILDADNNGYFLRRAIEFINEVLPRGHDIEQTQLALQRATQLITVVRCRLEDEQKKENSNGTRSDTGAKSLP